MTRLKQIKLNTIYHSPLSSGEREIYEYLNGEDLGYKPGVVEKLNLSILY